RIRCGGGPAAERRARVLVKESHLVGTQHLAVDLNVIQQPLITVGPGGTWTGRVGVRGVGFRADGQQHWSVEQHGRSCVGTVQRAINEDLPRAGGYTARDDDMMPGIVIDYGVGVERVVRVAIANVESHLAAGERDRNQIFGSAVRRIRRDDSCALPCQTTLTAKTLAGL